MALKVRIPLDQLKSFTVSFPIKSYISAPAPNGQALVERVLVSGEFPNGWSVTTNSGPSTTLFLAIVYETW